MAQHQPMVFACAGTGGRRTARYLAPAGVTESAFVIPAGTANFDLSMSVDDDKSNLDVQVYDEDENEYVVKHDTGLVNDERLTFLHMEAGKNSSVTLVYSGSHAIPERFAVAGTTSRPWRVEIANRDFSPAAVTFTYSYDMILGCAAPEAHGCSPYNPFWVQRTIADWSVWAAAVYGTAAKAWKGLAEPMEDPAGSVPFYRWGYIWNTWPHAEDKGAPWQDVFHYLSGGKDAVDQAGFEGGFALGKVSTAAKECVSELRVNHTTRGKAWAFLQKGGLEAQDSLIKHCASTSGTSPTLLQSFMTGVDGTAGFGEREFEVSWDEVNACPEGYYRSAPIVYHCHESWGRASYFMRAGKTELVTELPKGVQNMRIGAVADQDIDLMLKDLASGKWVVKWEGGVVNRKRVQGTYSGARITFSGDESEPPLVEEYVQLEGSLPVPLEVQVKNPTATDVKAHITYSWDRVNHCPDGAPRGCSRFNSTSAQSVAANLSSWMKQKYSSKDAAWKDLCQHLLTPGIEPSGSKGVAFHRWTAVWRSWPGHAAANGSWQENFHFVDSDRNGAIDEGEFHSLHRLHEELQVTKDLLIKLDKQYLDLASSALSHTSGEDGAGITPDAWAGVMEDFVTRDMLPGNVRLCQEIPALKPYVFAHAAPMKISPGMTTPMQSKRVAQAQSLGLVGRSFTALARIWRDRAGKAMYPGMTQERPENNLVFSTPSATEVDYHLGNSLFLGVRNSSLTMSFGAVACATDFPVPFEEWLTVAWIYDAKAEEQRIHLNGRTVQTCLGVKPYQGFGQDVWLGKCNDNTSLWGGELNSMYLFPSAFSNAEVSRIFVASAVWSRPQELSIKSEQDAVEIGRMDELGLDGGSFTVVLRLWRDESQEDDVKHVYTILGTPLDNSLEMVVWNGVLGMSFDGKHCASNVLVPRGRWVRVAFVYNAKSWEQLLYQDGKLVTTCTKVEPYLGADRSLWLGKSAPIDKGSIQSWSGTFRDVQVLDRSECIDRIEELLLRSLNEEAELDANWKLGPDAVKGKAAIDLWTPRQTAAAPANGSASQAASRKALGSSSTLHALERARAAAVSHVQALAAGSFKSLDTDHSGTLTQSEVLAAIARATGRHPGKPATGQSPGKPRTAAGTGSGPSASQGWDEAGAAAAATKEAAGAAGITTTTAPGVQASSERSNGAAAGPSNSTVTAAGTMTMASTTAVPGAAVDSAHASTMEAISTTMAAEASPTEAVDTMAVVGTAADSPHTTTAAGVNTTTPVVTGATAGESGTTTVSTTTVTTTTGTTTTGTTTTETTVPPPTTKPGPTAVILIPNTAAPAPMVQSIEPPTLPPVALPTMAPPVSTATVSEAPTVDPVAHLLWRGMEMYEQHEEEARTAGTTGSWKPRWQAFLLASTVTASLTAVLMLRLMKAHVTYTSTASPVPLTPRAAPDRSAMLEAESMPPSPLQTDPLLTS